MFPCFHHLKDSKLDVTIGPYETYEDSLFGYKVSFHRTSLSTPLFTSISNNFSPPICFITTKKLSSLVRICLVFSVRIFPSHLWTVHLIDDEVVYDMILNKAISYLITLSVKA